MKKTKSTVSKQFISNNDLLKKIPEASRFSIITQKMIGKLYKVYNGRTFSIIVATNLKLGSKFGEYVFTKKSCIHKIKKKKKK